jgi:tetratricopeptide (TPR) repeat protein
MRTRHLVFALTLVMSCLAAGPGAAPDEPSAVALLNRYERGEFDAVVETFQKLAAVEPLRKDLERTGVTWADSAGAGDVARRRLVAATMALEFANARMDDEWQTLRSLVEWGCALLRRGPPSESERIWQEASIAVAGGAFDDALLFSPETGLKSYDHQSHASKRFPADARIAFAAQFAVRAMPHPGGLTLRGGIEPDVDAPKRDPSTWSLREPAVRKLTALFDNPEVGAEAAIRAGHLQMINLRLDEALVSFDTAITHSRTGYATYLAHFLRGRTLERMNRLDEAERAYALAAAAVPHAQSAVLADASLLMRAGRTTEANEMVAASFAVRPRPRDPWRLFPAGEYYRWPELIAVLRAEISR